VLIGSPGLRDNLELPLSYTIVGMPIALIVWMLLNREPRIWREVTVILLTLIAIGFKEQGLVIVPVIIAAWWMRAPGATRGLAAAAAIIAVTYVALRLSAAGSWPMFQQAVGYGFSELEPREAIARFGSFPLWIYIYSGASTVANVLFSEPTRGVFWITRDFVRGQLSVSEVVQLASAVALTVLIAWWGARCLIADRRRGSSLESRTFVALVAALLACGILSFNYSRDRLGGMATVFYALAAYFAVRAAASRAASARGLRSAVAAVALVLLGGAWFTRAVATTEYVRMTARQNERQWLVMLPERRAEFADRPVYLRIMESLVEQGTAADAARIAHDPADTLADAIASGDVHRAFALIRARQSANDLMPARHPAITDGRWVLVSPLVWSVAAQQKDMVLMLLGHGAHPVRAMDRQAVCLAQQLGNEDIARALRLYSDAPAQTCSGRVGDDAPLVTFLANLPSGQ